MTLPTFTQPSRLVLNSRSSGTKVLTKIQQNLNSCKGFKFYVAFANQEGVASIFQTLLDLQSRSIMGDVLLSQYLNFTDPAALRTLHKLRNLNIRIATAGAVHSKGYYFYGRDSNSYLIGSSNWTASALSTNTELNVEIKADSTSSIALELEEEFTNQWNKATTLSEEFIDSYEQIYNESLQRGFSGPLLPADPIFKPNEMQNEALASLNNLRALGKNKALIVSATGTGKTFLSAFDAQAFNAKRLLFIVHRENIAQAALKTFRAVFHKTRTFGLYTGGQRDTADFLFGTVQTLSRDEHLSRFDPAFFDYIVVDESHRAGAASYQRFLSHFKPKFLLGMTATPERTDGADIFAHFDHNIGYEIRLQRALEEKMLCPFHYFGVSDLSINGTIIDDVTDFNKLVAPERISKIIEKSRLYGCWDNVLRGLIFCSRVEEAKKLSEELNQRGYRTVALSGAQTEAERESAILRLEAEKDCASKLDFILTVDIFNEGVDIPKVNQIILLRPTQSAIIFVQQLGRGLRKTDSPDKYLTVIDFIGNYENNYLIPIALYGDRSYDKDRVRRLLASGSLSIPGTSTVDFEPIVKERIFNSINSARLMLSSDLSADYKALLFRLGRSPMMMDFVDHDSRDPIAFSEYAGSFYSFAFQQEPEKILPLGLQHQKVLKGFSKDALNGKSLEEALIIKTLIESPSADIVSLESKFRAATGLLPRSSRWQNAVVSCNLRFLREKVAGALVPVGQSIGVDLLSIKGNIINRLHDFDLLLATPGFSKYLSDLAEYAIQRFLNGFNPSKEVDGFQRYRKYSRADVFRILGAAENPVAQNVGGYLIDPANKEWCPIFVTYKKGDDIAATIQYEDAFLSSSKMRWFTKNNRRLSSPDVQFLRSAGANNRVLLFIKKSVVDNNEADGKEFYFIGNVSPDPATFKEESMNDGFGGTTPVVTMNLDIDSPVEDSLYNYLLM